MDNQEGLAIDFWRNEFSISFASNKYNEYPDPQILDPIWERFFPPMIILSDIIKEISLNQNRNSNNITNCIFDYHNRIDFKDQIDDEESYSKYKLVFFQKLLKIIEKLFEDSISFPNDFHTFNDLLINLYCIIKPNKCTDPQFSTTDTDFLIRFLENLPCSTNFSVFTWGFSSHLYDPKDPKFLNIRADVFFEILLNLNRQKHWILSTFFNSSGAIDLFLDQMMPFVSNNLNLFTYSKSQNGNFLIQRRESLFILIELIFDILICYHSEISRFNETVNRLWKKLLIFISHNGDNNNENSDISLEIHVFRCCVRFLNFFRKKLAQPQFTTFFNSFIFACEKSYHLRLLSLQYVIFYKQFGIPVIRHFRNLFEQEEEETNTLNTNFDDDDDNGNNANDEPPENSNPQTNDHQNSLLMNKSIDHNSILIIANYYKENLNNRSENFFQFIQLCMFQAVKDKILSHTICTLLPPLLVKARNETQWMISFIKHITYFCVFALLKKKYMGRVILIIDLLAAIYTKVMESIQIEISNDAALMYATKKIPFTLISKLNPSPKFDKAVFHDLKVRCNRETDFSKEILEQKIFKSNFTEPLIFSKLTPRQPQQPHIPHDIKASAPRNNYKTCPSNISILSANANSTRTKNRGNYINSSSFSYGSHTTTTTTNNHNNIENNDSLSMHSIVQNRQTRGRIHQIQQVKQQPSNTILYKSQFSNQPKNVIGSTRKSLMQQYQHQSQIPQTSSTNANLTKDISKAPENSHQLRSGIGPKIEPKKPVVKICPSKKVRGPTTQRLLLL